ncbi:MAG: hypothetical protein ABI823_06290 [Bryobacteraceae bacterium]
MHNRLSKFLLVSLLCAASAMAADPFLGSWKLNLTKSKFDGETAPASLVVTWAGSAPTLTISGEGKSADGRAIRYQYDPIYDGKEYPPKGPWNWDRVSNKQVDANTREDTYRKGGHVIRVERRTVSSDGRTLTYVIRVEASHGAQTSIMVFDRVN